MITSKLKKKSDRFHPLESRVHHRKREEGRKRSRGEVAIERENRTRR